ncbi:MAG TPA: hypothetical protein VFA12_14040 [Stellaceae bacterium]|nr:hypothetical protein [Stellaceae bacterium]
MSSPLRLDPPIAAADLDALRARIRGFEQPLRHGTLPFGLAAIDRVLPGGGLALGAVHEILGVGGDEEDAAIPAAFAAAIIARLGRRSLPSRNNSPSPPAGRGERVGVRGAGPPNDTILRPKAAPPQTGHAPSTRSFLVIAGLDPAVSGCPGDGRVKPGDDDLFGTEQTVSLLARNPFMEPHQEAAVLWCSARGDLYGPGLALFGLDPARLVLVAARRGADVLWAMEEGLRQPGLAAVVGEIARLPMVAGRRLQLAAERSGVTAFVLRRWCDGTTAAAERGRPSAAATRWRVAALPAADTGEPGIGRPRWRIELLRCRGGAAGCWEVEAADASGLVSVPAELADRPAPQRPGAARWPERRAG